MKLAIVAGIALGTLVIAACSEKVPPPEPPRPVATIVVDAGSADSKRSFAGEVRARHETPLGFRISGKLQRRLVDSGAAVKAGQPLALLDPADVALEAVQAEAQRAQAEAELKRYRDMRAQNFISQSALDEREAAFKAAQAQAGLTRNAQAYATLRADAAGVIAATLAEPGQVVAAGEPVVVLAQAGEREVAISLPESSVGLYRVDDMADVRLWAARDKTYRGKVREISAAADPATRTYPARITLLDADAAVVLGMSGHVDFVSKQANSVVVPAAAIYQQGEQPAVWVVDAKGITALRPVKVATWRDGGVLVTEGLEPGERIVASGVHKVHAGEKVSFMIAD
ncbi:MAG: efflux RND transporter periplasmic adaptor subunit [Steroidobacteraceae bacterium]